MTNACPSVTAWRVARHRAKHQIAEHGAVFSDPLALPIIGENADVLATEADTEGEKNFRLFMAIRSRIVEDKLAEAVQRGVRQAVVMGGGVDTLGLRNPHAKNGLTVYEVDQPVMQDWKRSHLAQLGLSAPTSLIFVPVDFEQDSLRACLTNAGFDLTQPAFFSWLGVVPYLTQDAIEKTLRFVASQSGSEIVFDYGEPLENYEGTHRTLMEERSAFVASVGEPWRSRFNPQDMHAILRQCGLSHFTDYDRTGISAYFGWPNKKTDAKASPHVVDAFSD